MDLANKAASYVKEIATRNPSRNTSNTPNKD
jgi:hypothetical protein